MHSLWRLLLLAICAEVYFQIQACIMKAAWCRQKDLFSTNKDIIYDQKAQVQLMRICFTGVKICITHKQIKSITVDRVLVNYFNEWKNKEYPSSYAVIDYNSFILIRVMEFLERLPVHLVERKQ